MSTTLIIVLLFVVFCLGCLIGVFVGFLAGLEHWRKSADSNKPMKYRGMKYKVYTS